MKYKNIKNLRWDERKENGKTIYIATVTFGEYKYCEFNLSDEYSISFPNGDMSRADTLEQAKMRCENAYRLVVEGCLEK